MRQSFEMFYRGSRTYIQGSLIASTAARWFAGDARQAGTVLERIRFKRICNGDLVLTDEPPAKLDSLGDIVLRRDGERHRLYLAEVADSDPPRRPDDASRLLDYRFEGPLRCLVTAAAPADMDDLLCAVIETVKRCVGDTYPGAADIWFVGLQDSTIAADGAAYDGAPFAIEVSDGLENDQGPRRLTQNALRLDFASGTSWQANILFACRLPVAAT